MVLKIDSFCFLINMPQYGSCLGHFWPCWDHVCPDFICRPPTDLKFSGLCHYDLRIMSMEWLLLKTMSMPFLDHANHAYPSFTFRLAKSLKFSRLSQHGLRHTSMKCPLFGTMSGPCLYHVKTTFDLDLLSDELALWKIQHWVNMV